MGETERERAGEERGWGVASFLPVVDKAVPVPHVGDPFRVTDVQRPHVVDQRCVSRRRGRPRDQVIAWWLLRLLHRELANPSSTPAAPALTSVKPMVGTERGTCARGGGGREDTRPATELESAQFLQGLLFQAIFTFEFHE